MKRQIPSMAQCYMGLQIFLQMGDQQDPSETGANSGTTWRVKIPSSPCINHMESQATHFSEAPPRCSPEPKHQVTRASA
ncbi:hypothetical protein BHE74_00004723 [Ensete ventricosum]|uniref:Uncharacterized protein n=1 Tax=Ensete ventricosum TaxID=4639 RepID=A0A427AVP9_ENSVE|nr:hypothetical protein B296_00011285 [Ensete ventricosum]RWW25572.1 hypothetical protein GW17_00010083 [Ensete ventricosum]RWW86499.1 hypothetical protein BHE74_00004723 [Ensete ventricosum]RZR76896.1 hypothetical protein BHM03_00001796 [Ensete ventricosum]